MKRIYIVFNKLTQNCLYHEGDSENRKYRNRKELFLEDIPKNLSFIPKKRKAILSIENIP